MKILMTSDTYLPRLGGGEYHVHYLLQELRKAGHDVVLFTTEPGNDKVETGIIRVSYKGLSSVIGIFRALWLASADRDLIHAHYSYRLGCIAATVAFIRRLPFTVTQHGLGLLPQVGASFVYETVFRFWRYWTMRCARLIISTSEDMSVVIRECGFGDRIVPISNGYDADLFRPLPAPDFKGPNLLTVRRLTPKNGVQYLVAAMPALVAVYPAIHLTCVGDGPWKGRIATLAKDLGIEKHVTFQGPVDHACLLDFYRNADIVVLPSTAESTSLTCIEAMALARPVVASRVGGLIELIGLHEEHGYLAALTTSEHSDYNASFTLPPDRISALADRISYAVAHREETMRKAEQASMHAAKYFSWSTIARRTIKEVYVPLLSSSL